MSKNILIPLLAVALTAGALFYFEPEINNGLNLTKDEVQCQYRMAIMMRAQHWVDLHVPYNQQGTYDGWRTDCQGYVSMCWNLDKPGLTTYTMHTVAHNIGKDELQNGDALNCDSRHIVIFGGWTDGSRSQFISFEEANSSTGTIKRVTPYPYWNSDSCFHPIRLNNVC